MNNMYHGAVDNEGLCRDGKLKHVAVGGGESGGKAKTEKPSIPWRGRGRERDGWFYIFQQ